MGLPGGGMRDRSHAAATGSRVGPAAPERPEWHGLVEELHEAVVAAGTDGLVRYVNPAAEALLGWAGSDLVGRPLVVILPERFREAHQAGFTRFVTTGEATVMGRPLRVPALRADGNEIEVELVVTTARAPEGRFVVGLLRDVSDRLELEGDDALAESLVAALTEAVSLDEALPRVLAGLGSSMGWDVAQLWLETSGGRLARRSSWAREPTAVALFLEAASLGRWEGLPGRVWRTRAPAWVENFADDVSFPRAAAAAAVGLRDAFAFPLLSQQRVIGVVELLSHQPHGVNDHVGRRMQALGGKLGGFIERRLLEEERLALLEAELAARTEAEAARERLAFIAEASRLLSESLDLDVTLDGLASLAVPSLGDWCVIHLRNDDAVRVAAVAHADPDRVATLLEAHDRYPVDLRAPGGVGRVISSGAVIRHDDVSDDVLRAIARDDEHLDLLRRLGFGAVVTAPLQVGDHRFGALTVARRERRSLDDSAVAVVLELARRAATAIDNARLHHELHLQTAILRSRGEAGMEGQLVVGPDGRMISYNGRFVEMWDFPEAVIRAGVDERALAVAAERVEDPIGFRMRVEHAYATKAHTREELRLRDGRVFDRVGAPMFDGQRYLGYAWYFRDVTDHKRIEAALAASAARSAELAHTLQQSLLPPALPTIAGVDLGARYVPSSLGLDVGGDFYDVFRLGRGTWGLVVGDVCGHGAEAAAVTAFTRYTLRAAAGQTRSPAKALRLLNDAMLRESDGQGRYVTVATARLSPRREGLQVVLALGGHPPPILCRASGAATVIGSPGTLLGVLAQVRVQDSTAVLRPGDRLVMVTDGVTEARRGREQFGTERLVEVVRDNRHLSASDLAGAVTTAAADHARGAVSDDMAVLVVAATSPSPETG